MRILFIFCIILMLISRVTVIQSCHFLYPLHMEYFIFHIYVRTVHSRINTYKMYHYFNVINTLDTFY
jgi:hypothetical protein